MKVFHYFLWLFLFFTLSSIQSSEPKKRYKILIPIPCHGGEAEMAIKVETAARSLGWEAQAFYFANSWGFNYPFDFNRSFKPFEIPKQRPNYLSKVIEDFQPDFFLCYDPNFYSPRSSKIPHYLVLSRPLYLEKKPFSGCSYNGKCRKRLLEFDGILCVPNNQNRLDAFLKFYEKKIPSILWTHTSMKTTYHPLQTKKVFYTLSTWDHLRSSEPYKEFLKKLDEYKLVEFWGPVNCDNYSCYRGLLPIDGNSLIEAIRNCGIALILHSQEHLDGGVITGRIFEAAAAGSVIISDKHEFVEKEFGDTVLYLDIDKDHKLTGEKMFEQIYAHLMWIFSHPKEAEEKAQKAHKIFDDKFTLESQLERLGEFHASNDIHLEKDDNPKKIF
ncbi:glycosyltransferase family 1 protein [bacterium]|nr:glycosyltransferase family 1 protein [bacterium]